MASNSAKISEESQRRQKWKAENERRRHNYIPMIFEVLKQLAQKNMLSDLLKEAQEAKEKKANADVEMKA
jgi:ubiquitin carboxyl-terminal hydrolase L5